MNSICSAELQLGVSSDVLCSAIQSLLFLTSVYFNQQNTSCKYRLQEAIVHCPVFVSSVVKLDCIHLKSQGNYFIISVMYFVLTVCMQRLHLVIIFCATGQAVIHESVVAFVFLLVKMLEESLAISKSMPSIMVKWHWFENILLCLESTGMELLIKVIYKLYCSGLFYTLLIVIGRTFYSIVVVEFFGPV